MMRFSPVPEPERFDAEVRTPGRAWLAEHPGAPRPRPLWAPYVAALAEGFHHLCGYTVMHVEDGQLDHYLSYKNYPSLAFDPYEVHDHWFEILLPSLQLVTTSSIPSDVVERARHTLQRLGLRDSEPVVRRRRAWYEAFRSAELPLAGLHRYAPLIARAVEARLAQLDAFALGDERAHYERFLRSELTMIGLRSVAPHAFNLVVEALDRATC